GTPHRSPSISATSTAWYLGTRSCLYADASSSSTTTMPNRSSGANTALRDPTTTSSSPARMRRHSAARSASVSAEWITATRRGELGGRFGHAFDARFFHGPRHRPRSMPARRGASAAHVLWEHRPDHLTERGAIALGNAMRELDVL